MSLCVLFLQPRKGTVHVKDGIFGWGKRELSLVHGVKLQLCKIEREKVTDACEVRECRIFLVVGKCDKLALLLK
ncbi:unnamed protein product [Scytosiphon promiscuus]